MDTYLISVLSNIGMLAFIALSAYLLLLVGEISFGQQAFFAISAYASGIATAMWGWPFWLGLVWGSIRLFLNYHGGHCHTHVNSIGTRKLKRNCI